MALSAVLALVLAGMPAPALAAGAAPPAPALAVGAWNTDLEPWLPGRQAVIDTIAGSTLDVLGLQGVWSDDARAAILADPRVAAKYPYSYTPTPAPEAGTCPPSVSRPFETDLIDGLIADGVDTRQVAQPTVPVSAGTAEAGLQLQLLSQRCFGALVNTMATLPNGAAAYGAIDIAASGNGVKYDHGGSSGQLVLSNRPIENPTTSYLDSYLRHRSTVSATVAGLRLGFADWPRNYLEDINPALRPLQDGVLQPDAAVDVVVSSIDVLAGTVNSAADYQPDGNSILVNNGFRRLVDAPTYCPAATHSAFAPCVLHNQYTMSQPVSLGLDSVFVRDTGRCRTSATFATVPSSDHIGVSAVCAKNTAPTAANDSYSTPRNTALTVGAPGVLGNDTDGEADPLTVTPGAAPAHAASFTLNPDGSFSYVPVAGYTGPDTFGYTVNDGTLNSAVATATITVTTPVVFPTTPVLDTFARADGPVGAGWSGLTGTSFYRVAGQRLDVQLGGPLIWKNGFGSTQEAFVTLRALDPKGPAQGVLLKVQSSSVPDAGAISVTYDAKAKAVLVSTLRVGARSWAVYPAKAVTLAAGDVLGGTARADGTVEVYRNGALLTAVALASADKAFFAGKGGRVGIMTLAAPNALLDDFGGGTAG